MADLTLERDAAERRLYRLGSIGTLRLLGRSWQSATAEAPPQQQWQLTRRGSLRRTVEATDQVGLVVGEFTDDVLRRGGELRWDDRSLVLHRVGRHVSIVGGGRGAHFSLADHGGQIASLASSRSSQQPVQMGLADGAAVPPGLLLFVAFVVRSLAPFDTGAGLWPRP